MSTKKTTTNSPAISFIISTYDGLTLLKENLPAVIAEARKGDEILITEDAGPDLTVPYFRAKYNLELVQETEQYRLYRQENSLLLDPAGKKPLTLTLIENKNNLRFSANNNQAVQLAQSPLVFILNNDSAPQKGCVKNLLRHFQTSKNKNVLNQEIFAVTALEISPFQDNQCHGKNKLWFQKGRFMHSKADDWNQGQTAWACGGSSLYNRQKFLDLGGFDKLFYPAYWEDIDLSYQAQKKGWQVIFEPLALVHHNHQTTNQTVFGQQKIDEMSWRNGSKFTWKNSNFQQKIQFLLWQPYWFIKRQPFWSALILILLVATLSRLVYLAQIPPGLTWDETAIGYNGWAVWKTRRDEWLQLLPISFRSFGDYKAPLGIYFSGLFTTLFGLSPFTVRLGFALSSIIGILGFALLVKKILSIARFRYPHRLTLLATFIFAFTPWIFFFSRGAWEVGLALTLTIWGVYFLITYFRQPVSKNNWARFWQFLLAVLCLVATFYNYHSSKIVTPLLVVAIYMHYKGNINRRFLPILTALFIGFLTLIPFGYDTIFGEGMTRANTSSFLFNSDLTLIEKTIQVVQNLFAQLQPSFLAFGNTGLGQYAHGTQDNWGVFLLPTFLLFFIGLGFGVYYLFKRRKDPLIKLFTFSLSWILIGSLPSAIAMEVPHAVRGLLALPGFLLLAVFAVTALINLHLPKIISPSSFSRSTLAQSVLMTTFIIHFLFGAGYLHHYFTRYPQLAGADFNAGAYQASQLASQYEPTVEKILFSTQYGHPYIYSLLAQQTTPYSWHGGGLVKYEFSENITVADLNRSQTLIVIGEEDFANFPYPSSLLQSEITDPYSGQVRYRFYLTNQ